MKTFDTVDSLTLYKQRMVLPHNKNNKAKWFIVFSMNTSHETLGKILNNDHPMLSNNGGLYKIYYYDYQTLSNCIKSPKIHSKVIQTSEAKKKRISDYAVMDSLVSNLKTPLTETVIADKNVLYDLNPIAEIYASNKKVTKFMIKPRLEAFFKSVDAIVGKDFSFNDTTYTKSCILVNLDEWGDYLNDLDKFMSHPLANIVILLKRSDKYIAQFQYDTKFLFFNKKGYFLFDMAKDLSKENLSKLKLLLKRLDPTIVTDTHVKKIENREISIRLSMSFNPEKPNFNGMTGEEPDDIDIPEEKIETAADIIKKVTDEVEDVTDEKEMDGIEKEIFKDEELKQEYMDTIVTTKTRRKSEKSLARDNALREKQKDIVVKTKTIGELAKTADIPEITVNEVKQVPSTYTHVKDVKFANFEKDYMEGMYEKHIAAMITSMTDKSVPVNIVNIKVEDTSSALTLQETYTVTLEDGNRKRHTLKFNLPKFVDNKFMYINGNKKTIQKQFFPYPVVKTAPDTVVVSTNYNKIFTYRTGNKLSVNSEKFRKLIEDEKHNVDIKVFRGCATDVNKKFLTCLEYDELAAQFAKIQIGKATFVFNAEELDELFDGKEKSTLDKYLVGYTSDLAGKNKKPIYYHTKNNEEVSDLITLMVSYTNTETQQAFKHYTTGKKFIYNQSKVMAKNMPTVLILSFFEGLSTVIRKFDDPSVRFTDKKEDRGNMMYIKFADGYLEYPMANIEACILFNGFQAVTTGCYTIAQMDERTTYSYMYEELFGSSYVLNALLTYYEFMIDPITKDVLELLQYPTDFVGLMIYASNLLADNDYANDINLSMYRMRDNEVVTAILYKNIVRSYATFRQTANNPNPMKIQMDPDAVIKELMALPTVEDYSTLSPMVEVHKASTVSMKGANGLNLDKAYKSDKRAYDDSMLGICAITTDAGPNCGKIRELAVEPRVVNALGFMDIGGKESSKEYNNANLAAPIEMLTPLSFNHDEPSRNNMASKQTTHVIPVEHNCPVLVSTGMDQSIHYRTGNDFSVVAKDNGKVVELDNKNQLMIIEYKTGEKQAIDLSPHAVKNGGGGFYLINQLITEYKVGQTFKKNDIIAYDPKFYMDQNILGNRLTMGSLMKVACLSHFSTFEDSTFITKHMSEQMASNLTMKKEIILGPNSTVGYIVKPGQAIEIGDPLIKFETSFDDNELNKLLSNVRDDMKEEIIALGKNSIKSHYTGKISDVIIYYTSELKDLSPSIQKIIKENHAVNKSRLDIIKKHSDKDQFNPNSPYQLGALIDKPTGKTDVDRFGKIKGLDLQGGILIEVYITYHDELSDGDKLAAFTANKNTVGYQIRPGFEPYSEFRKYEEISAPVSPSAIIQRNTPSIIITGCCYKVLIELKRRMYELLTGENFDEVLKQKNPWLSSVKLDKMKKGTTESLIEISDSEISILESAFDLTSNDDGKYISGTYYTDGSIICPIDDKKDCSKFLNHFGMAESGYNAVIDEDSNCIKALSFIKPNEPIVLEIV